jgi:hypothetical protein
MSALPTIALAAMAAADVITILLLAALGLAALRVIRHAQSILRGLGPETQPMFGELRALLHRMRATAGVARDGAQHVRTSVGHFGDAAGHIRALVAPPTLSRWGLLAGSKSGRRAARNWYSKRRTA